MKTITLVALLFILCLLVPFSLTAQKTVKVKGARGQWEVSDNITGKQAEDRALMEAKKDALQKAGVMENVWSVFGIITHDDGQELQDVYSSLSVLAIGGMLNVTDKKVDDFWDQQAARLYKVVTINAIVKKEDEPDPSYALDVNGIASVYNANEPFRCTVKVHGADSYLKFFWFDNAGGALLYPNEYERGLLFVKDSVYNFPLNGTVDYQLFKNNPSATSEKVNVMVVATKKDIPFVKEVTYANVLGWIYSIPSAQRCAFYQLLVVR